MIRAMLICTALVLAGCSRTATSALPQKPAANGGQRVYSYFSPNGEAKAAMIRAVNQAEREVLIALYYFTDAPMADAVIAAKERGCAVRVILDRTQAHRADSQAQRLVDAGITVTFDRRHRLMHNKFCVMDRESVITGSQNWTAASDASNAENTLIIRNNRHLADKYRETFLSMTAQNNPSHMGN